MDFTTFRTACKWAKLAFADQDDHTKLKRVCKKIIPQGESWGKCDEAHCTYFGCKGSKVRIFADDKLIATADSVEFVLE